MLRNSKGSTPAELICLIVILGIFGAIAIPKYNSMRDRAREGSVKANMHTLQLAVEDFAVNHDGVYPTAADAQAVIALMPGGVSPINPFTSAPSIIFWGEPPTNPGDLSYEIPAVNEYDITAYGAHGLLLMKLSNY